MKKIAMIRNGIVENIALWDGISNWNPQGFQLVDVTNVYCDIGFIFDGQNFLEPIEE